jgi:hypothetical protein
MFKGCSSILISRTRVRSRGSQLSKLHLQFYPAREHDLRSFDELSAEIAKILGRLCRIRKRMKKAKALKTREPENPKNPAMKMITKNVSFKNHGKKIVFMESKNNLDCYLLEEKIKKERNVWNIIEPMSSVSLRNAFEDNPKRFKRTTAVTGSETQFGRTSEPP